MAGSLITPIVGNSKFILVVAGPNGSGKTTFAKEMLGELDVAYLNPDEILLEAGGFTKPFGAARQLIINRNRMLNHDKSIVLETTLAGKTMESFLGDAKRRGYKIYIFFTWLDNPELCIERIRIRVANGGHYIPDEQVRQRFYRSHYNFWSTYRIIANEWVVYYNGHTHPKLVVAGKGSRFEISDTKLYKHYGEIVNECRLKAIRGRDKKNI